MKDFAAFFYLLMLITQSDVEFTETEKLQIIKDFNAGKQMQIVQIQHRIGDSMTITRDAE